MTALSREQLRVELYGGEDYHVYDGGRLVAIVYAETDLSWLLDRDIVQRDLLRQREEEIAQLRGAVTVMQSSRDILLNTFTLWAVEYQKGKMALRELPDLRAQLKQREEEMERLKSERDASWPNPYWKEQAEHFTARCAEQGTSIADLRAQLAATQQHLEQQQTATYQAVERDHEAKRQMKSDLSQQLTTSTARVKELELENESDAAELEKQQLTTMAAARDRLQEICESVAEEVLEYLNISTPSGKPAEPSLDEAVACACQWDRTNDGEGKPDPVVECQYHLKIKARCAELEQALNEIANMLTELNPSNYDQDDVEAQNSSVIGAINYARQFLRK